MSARSLGKNSGDGVDLENCTTKMFELFLDAENGIAQIETGIKTFLHFFSPVRFNKLRTN